MALGHGFSQLLDRENMSEKHNIFAWAAWYPTQYSNDALFVRKHLQLLATQHHVRVLFIDFSGKHLLRRSFVIRENVEEVIYYLGTSKWIKALAMYLLPFLEAMRFALKNKNFGILHLHVTYPTAAFMSLLHKLPFSKRVFTEHWTGYNDYDGRFHSLPDWMKTKLKANIKRMHAGSYVSKVLMEAMSDKSMLARYNFQINNIVEPVSEIKSIEKTSYFSFCTLSRLEDAHKNISGMLEAFAVLIKKYPELKLHIYGDGPDSELLKSRARKWKLENHVIFEGRIPNTQVHEAYARHHAFLLFSNYETFSIATAEALLSGLPCIATRSGGPEEYLSEEMGIVVEVKQVEQWVQAMEKLYLNYKDYAPEKIKELMNRYCDKNLILWQFNEMYKV